MVLIRSTLCGIDTFTILLEHQQRSAAAHKGVRACARASSSKPRRPSLDEYVLLRSSWDTPRACSPWPREGNQVEGRIINPLHACCPESFLPSLLFAQPAFCPACFLWLAWATSWGSVGKIASSCQIDAPSLGKRKIVLRQKFFFQDWLKQTGYRLNGVAIENLNVKTRQ